MSQIVGISCYLGVFFWMGACIYQEAGKVQSLQYYFFLFLFFIYLFYFFFLTITIHYIYNSLLQYY